MKRYSIVITGETPLIMHQDNIIFAEKVAAWRDDPANKGNKVPGDDRTPAWTWIGYTYHDGKEFGIPSDNLMTMLREGGSKLTKRGKETYKKQTQSGIMLDQQQFQLLVGGKPIPVAPIRDLIGNNTFTDHVETAESLGFELLVKRAKISTGKHVRIRPMFRDWSIVGSLTVLDEEMSGLTKDVLERVLTLSGAMCGLGDWRPSSGSSGTFGRFTATVKEM